jgi:hypothetical protein
VIHLNGNVRIDKSALSGLVPSVLFALLPNILDVTVAFDAVLSADADKPASVTPTSVTLTPVTYDEHAEVGSGVNTLPHVSVGIDQSSLDTSVSVAGLDLSLLTDDILEPLVLPTLNLAAPVLSDRVAPLVDPLIDKVNGIVAELSSVTGLNIGGADFYGLPYPNCQSPELVQ